MTDEAPKKKRRKRSPEARARRRVVSRANQKARRLVMSKAEKRHEARRVKDRRRVAFSDKPITTIFADAGFSGASKTGSWGVWMKTDGRQALSKGGPLLGEIASSVEAEMRALANALALARAARFAPDGACVMVQSDCQAALSWVLGALPKNSCHRPAVGGVGVVPALRIAKALERSAGLRAFVKIAIEAELKIVVRHVRGHKAGDGRQWVNRHVDKLARQHRVRPHKAASEEGETP